MELWNTIVQCEKFRQRGLPVQTHANKLGRLHLLFRGRGYTSPFPRQLLSKMVGRLICLVAGVLAIGSGLANAHGSHSSDRPPSDDWATRHMMGMMTQEPDGLDMGANN
jgi:hypothetical protein